MSCELKTFAKLNLSRVQAMFGLMSEEKWLSSVHLALSPTGESLAVAHGCKIVYMESKFNYDQQENAFEISWVMELDDPNELITALLCIPLIASQSMVDWTCLVVGTQSGTVHFYTDTRFHLLSQPWQTEAIMNIKAQSGKNMYEELHIFSVTCICIIEGHNLFPTLRTLRQQYITAAPLSDIDVIPCRKWSYGHNHSQHIHDAITTGLQNLSTFDHLLTASLEGGFYARYKAAPPQISLVVGAGARPFIGFHYAKEGYAAPAFTDIASCNELD